MNPGTNPGTSSSSTRKKHDDGNSELAWILPSVFIMLLGAACMCLMLRYCKGRGAHQTEVISPRSVEHYRRGTRNDNTVVDSMPDGLGDNTGTMSSSRISGGKQRSAGSNRSTENY